MFTKDKSLHSGGETLEIEENRFGTVGICAANKLRKLKDLWDFVTTNNTDTVETIVSKIRCSGNERFWSHAERFCWKGNNTEHKAIQQFSKEKLVLFQRINEHEKA